MKTKINIKLLLIVGSLCWLQASAQYPFIFRNDGNFNKIDLTDEVIFHHAISPTDSTLMVGDTEIPLRSINYIDFRQADIPTLKFNLPDYPDYEWPKDKDTYLDATLNIEGCGTVEDKNDLKLTVKGRGNSTWSMLKKPLRLKFNKKTSICGFKKAKSYVLLANFTDNSHMRNAIALWLARRLDMEFPIETMPCNVYFNGNYCGLYLLTTKIGINSASVDIDENTGILFEASTEFDEEYKFYSSMNQPIMVKDPDFNELASSESTGLTPAELLALWTENLNDAEQKIYKNKGNEAFNMSSAVDYFLIMNLCNNSEIGFPKSVYFYKRDLNPESLYYFGPVWDFDVAFNFYTSSPDLIESDPEKELWKMCYFYYFENLVEFKQLYKQRLTELATKIYPELLEWINNYSVLIEPAAKLDGLRWPQTMEIGGWTNRVSSFNTEEHRSQLINWINRRINYILREAGLDLEVNSEAKPYSQTEVTSGEKKLNIHDSHGSIKSFTLNNALTISIGNSKLSVQSNEGDFVYPLTEVSRIDYSGAVSSDIYSPAMFSPRIEINSQYAIVESVSPALVEIIDLSGRTVFSTHCENEQLKIALSSFTNGIYILTLNGTLRQKFLVNNH